MLSKASYLDKRYSTLSFLPENKKESVKREILEELKELEAVWKESGSQAPQKKKKRFLCYDIDGEDTSDNDNCNQAEKEMKSFDLEGKLNIDEDPFSWWRSRKAKYPLMVKLARKYLAVQGTSTPAERVMSKLGRVLDKRRMAMKSLLFSALMFLSDCSL